MIALISLETNSIVKIYDEAPGRVEFPDGSGSVSPAIVGWEGGGVITYEEKEAVEGPPRFAFYAVEKAAVPVGKTKVSVTYEIQAGKVVEVVVFKDVVTKPALPTYEELVARIVALEAGGK